MAGSWDDWEHGIKNDAAAPAGTTNVANALNAVNAVNAVNVANVANAVNAANAANAAAVPSSILDANDIDMWRTYHDVSEYFQQFGFLNTATYDGFVDRVMRPNASWSHAYKQQPRPSLPNNPLSNPDANNN